MQVYVYAYPQFHIQQYNQIRRYQGFTQSDTWENRGEIWKNIFINWRGIQCEVPAPQLPIGNLLHADPLSVALDPEDCP
jgi:hypothetical protein